MKHIIGAYSVMLILVLNMIICISVITVNGDIAAAKEYKAAVVTELENSNFNPKVIEGCAAQASAAGYGLFIRDSRYNEEKNSTTAEVLLSYTYKIPLLGIEETKMTRAIAR